MVYKPKNVARDAQSESIWQRCVSINSDNNLVYYLRLARTDINGREAQIKENNYIRGFEANYCRSHICGPSNPNSY